MLRVRRSLPRRPAPSSSRTYVVLAVGEPATAGGVRALGTLSAPCRGAARALAQALHADVLPCRLRVVAAGSAPGDLVARALACDGQAVA
ncbi:hypothetical protein J421_6324 (plasmid) [Gemmatirosa kalamazoonensis]|uniref:Uncharacterized protein n=1 Tax=Gemmatirosa kalamazoonensis TaxID=861299 RepID=W0RSA0_9BACT|nr:hypothetical protein [Gemmatirosa kalamazoonensis]AHG93859.1 hypothetical protein J421_6324 [Gemmatirosa kalamazoonensis]